MAAMTADQCKAKGNEHFGRREFDEAAQWYGKAIEKDPSSTNAAAYYSNRAACYAEMSEYDLSAADAEMCISLRPTWEKGYFRKGKALMFKGDYSAAQKAFNDGLASNPDSAELKQYAGEAAQMRAEADKEILKRRVTTAAEAKEKGNVLFRDANYEGAIDAYTQALQLATADDPQKVTYLINRAACSMQLRLYDNVDADCTKALAIEPTNVKALLRRGLAREAMDKEFGAFSDFSEAQKLGALAPEYSNRLARLRKHLRDQGRDV
eukprot:c25283_g1_i1.p1 GENE.c25283_g1_i1~~c25283_g1_i1.p1  ORF type:complete len:276 (+),score=78.97 c25283_g1_i1:33-830(+)